MNPTERVFVKLTFLFGLGVFVCTNSFAITRTFRELTAKGDADLEAGKLDQALQEYNKIIALNLTPQLASLAVMRRGCCYYAKHDLERAIADHDQALRLDPRNAAAYDNRATALDARGDWRDAIKDYDESMRLNPRNPVVYLNRGAIFMEHGEFNAALADYAKTLDLNPHEENAHVGRAQIHLMRCEPDKALKEANAAVATAPGEAVVYEIRADVYNELRRYKEAEADIQTAMRMKSYDPTAPLSTLAWFRATCPDPRFRNGKEALQAARRWCGSTKFFHRGCLDRLAAAHAELGEFEQAVNCEKQAIAEAPSDSPKLQDMQERLDLYRKHKPFRDEPRKIPIQSRD